MWSIEMRCAACGYQKRTQEIPVEKLIRYKSGKNKGQIKEIKKDIETIYPNDPDWIELEFKKDVDQIGYKGRVWDFEEADLYACPKCGTVRISKFDMEY